MARDREERFEIQPKAPKRGADTPRAVAGVFKTITHYARQSRKLTPSRGRSSGGGGAPHFQRCAVRVTYASNRVRGQWRAHGKYVAREAATEAPEREKAVERESVPGASRAYRERVAPGYDARGAGIDVGQQLDAWQGAGDPRLFKFILSPEFGDRVNLTQLTRDVLGDLERQMGRPLTWVAVNHYNTEHPHTHVALRGVGVDGKRVLLSREMVQKGLRDIAQQAVTRQLGYRTRADRESAETRERVLTKVTSHDRRLRDVAQRLPDGRLRVTPHRAETLTPLQREGLRERLTHLTAMQLAKPDGRGSWLVQGDFDVALTALAESADRQRALARVHGAISDPHLPARATRWEELADGPVRRVAGRVLGHGESERGQGYLLLEGVDGSVHYFVHVPEIERAHARGEIRTGTMVELSAVRASPAERPVVRVESLGDARTFLRADDSFDRWERKFLAAGGRIAPGTEKGWLGQFAKARERLRSGRELGRSR
jgi:Protein of unknown function (DUF3363)